MKKKKKIKTKKVTVPKVLNGDISKLEEALGGDKELTLFFLSWLKHERNATKAYQELHPNVTYQVAGVLGSRMLKKVSLDVVLESYDLGMNTYFSKLKEGLEAYRKRSEMVDRDEKGRPIYETVHEPDYQAQRKFHEALGKQLGVEGNESPQTSIAVQFNNIINEDKKKYDL